MIYLESSALLKLLFREAETDALRQWLSARFDFPLFTSDLAKVETIRVCRRLDEGVLSAARALLATLDYVPLTAGLIERAGTVGNPTLRSLDAIHLVSALSVGAELSAFVAYDRRLQAAARDENLPVVAPA